MGDRRMAVPDTGTGSPNSRTFMPALRFRRLTPAYDAVVRVSCRERAVKRALLFAARLDRATRLLDIGCGTGTLAIEAKRRYPHLEVVGIDPDPDILTRARDKARRSRVSVTFLEGSATGLGVANGSFDRAVSSLVFHHLTTAQKCAAAVEVGKVLSDRGEFYLADWVKPANTMMRLLFRSVQLLDGTATTHDHAEGRLPELLAAGGLIDVVQHRTFATFVGTIGLISARPPTALQHAALA